MNTVEDYLELLVGLKNSSMFKIESSDISILQSIGRQVFRGTALTDRQYSLVKEKLLKYKDQFDNNSNFEVELENLRMPLREIDRSKYIKVCDYDNPFPNTPYHLHKSDRKWIKVRFPFSKKLIVELDKIQKVGDYHHTKGSHEHYFVLNEKNIHRLVEIFKDKNFDIDDFLIETYEQLEKINNNKHLYIPGVYNFEVKHLPDVAKTNLEKMLGKPTTKNLALYKDKQKIFGLNYFDKNDLEISTNNLSIISQKIINRTQKNVMVNSNKYTFDNLIYSIVELKRFPLLVILPSDNPLNHLVKVHRAFRNILDDTESTVLFRLDNDKNNDFNSYIKDNKLNSPLDKNTKIVYINDKIPKPLIKSDWNAYTALMLESIRPNIKTKAYLNEFDLVLQFDSNTSQYMRFQRQSIEEI